MTDAPTCLYRFFDADGHLLYVGITKNPASRLSEHLAGKPWAALVGNIRLTWFQSRKEAMDAERAAIMLDRPKHNVALTAHECSEGNAHMELIDSVYAFCARTGMSATTFGKLSVGDPNLVRQLASGKRQALPRTEARIRAFMQSYTPEVPQ